MMVGWMHRLVWLFRKRPAFIVLRAHDVPVRDTLKPGVAVLVGPRGAPKWLSLPCPCGCNVPYLLSLSHSRRPQWTVALDWAGRPTVTPSVRRLDGCRSHFWLRRGEVDWCRDSGEAAADDAT
jgi:hypothetical protein